MKRYLLPLAAVLLVLAGGYGLYVRTHSPAAAEVVRKFYVMWTDSSIHPLVERSYRGSPFLTREFQRRLDRLGRTFARTGFDPVVCGTEVPERFHVSFVRGDKAAPELRVSMQARDGTPQEPLVTVRRQPDGTWLVDGVACPEEPLAVPAAEQLLREQIGALSPTQPVLGGTFGVTDISWESDGIALVSYEDGHIALQARAAMGMEGGKPVVREFTLLEERAP